MPAMCTMPSFSFVDGLAAHRLDEEEHQRSAVERRDRQQVHHSQVGA